MDAFFKQDALKRGNPAKNENSLLQLCRFRQTAGNSKVL